MSNAAPQNMPSQVKRTSFSGFTGNNASILLDRTKSGFRGSTPDSEALASSDEEPDHLHRLQTVTSNPAPKPVRRASWFTEGQQGITRKPSLGNGPFSPVSPGTAGGSVDQAPWNTSGMAASSTSTLPRGHSNSASFPWGNTIWNNDSHKGPPHRLTEVLPSPTSSVPPGSAGFPDEHAIRSPPLSRESVADPSIPFSIPLQPTLKSYRSQSYSVGQIDPETAGVQSAHGAQTPFPRRGTSYIGLQHRPSRPSMLGDMTHDTNTLEQLQEVDDDEESSGGSATGQMFGDRTRTIEDIVGENAMLRQQIAANQLQTSKVLQGHALQPSQGSMQYYHQRLRDYVPKDAASPHLEIGDQEHYGPHAMSGARRFSEYSTRPSPHYALGVSNESKALDSVRKGQWQSSLGFARAEEPPQSRRHSFAELPTRHNSMESVSDIDVGADHTTTSPIARSKDRHENPKGYSSGGRRPSQGDSSKSAFSLDPSNKTEAQIHLLARHSFERGYAVSYFSQNYPSAHNGPGSQTFPSPTLQQMYSSQSHYPRVQGIGHVQPRTTQLLYIVTFKCLRADVFYVQEGTGLRIKKGDLVIVEADRGTDLGTVQTEDISWNEAKQLKEEYTKKHHEWLMAFSHHTQNGTIAGPNPNGPAVTQNAPGSSSSNHNPTGFQDLPSGEIKPKLIKRLAQTHEIATLREKEGGEAKAKRMCQQKVVDHRLSMEILDAEFQMDWKKLTFFYFADSYINFNPLVTDLFKIYKTRIWMSAINTAAIASPSGGQRILGLPSRSIYNHEYEDRTPAPAPHPQTLGLSSARGHVAPFNALYESGHNGMVLSGPGYEQMYPQALQGASYEPRQLSPYPMDFRNQGQQGMNAPSAFSTHGTYGAPQIHHTSSFTSQPDSNHTSQVNRPMNGGDWTQNFQGLSLGR